MVEQAASLLLWGISSPASLRLTTVAERSYTLALQIPCILVRFNPICTG